MKYKTDINIILDRSGSMSSLRETVVEQLNKFIQKNKQVKESARFNLYQFDTILETVMEDCDIQEVKMFTQEDFVPRGGTKLIDAGCTYIDKIGNKLSAMPQKDRPKQVFFVLITDGEENSSQEFKMEDLRSRINHQREKYKWQFVFIGTNEEGLKEANNYSQSVGLNNVITSDILTRYGQSPGEMLVSSFDYMASGLACMRSMNCSNVDNFNDLATSNQEI